jgi:hypothetical protein
MSLNKFIPLSPDPYITTDSDMGVAKFGHLNTIVDYLNSALNISKYNIIITKLNQTNPATFPIQKQDTVSIGTNYTPTANPLQTGDGNTYVGINTAVGADNSYFNTMIGYAASITIDEPKNVVVGAQASAGAADIVAVGFRASSTFAGGIAIGSEASVTAGQGVAIGRAARTTTTFGFALGNSSSLLQIGGNFVPTARVHVKGLGATSATTSLLVQNSAGTTAFQVKDNLQASVGDGFAGDGIRFEASGNSRIVFRQGADRIFLSRTNGDKLDISFITGTNVQIGNTGICTDGSGLNFWSFEGNINTAVTMDTTKYLKVYVAGVAYKLAVCV